MIFCCFALVLLATYVAADRRSAVLRFFLAEAATYGSGMPHGSKLLRPTPATHNSTAALRKRTSQSVFVVALTAMKRQLGSFLAARICSASLVKVDLGPNSTKMRAPRAYMDSICSIKRTEDTMWLDNVSLTARASFLEYGFPVTLEKTSTLLGA